MKFALRVTALGLLAVVAADAVAAGSIDRWSASRASEFLLGTFDGTSLDDEGRIALAPRLTHLWGPEPGIVWDLVGGPRGTVFVALSGPGRVIAIDAAGDSTVWYDAGEDALITCLAPDGQGGVWAGLSPEGRVLHLRGPGESAVLAETDASFVWTLAPDGRGGLWIGTGAPGKVQRFDSRGGIQTLYETDDDPVRSLIPIADGVVAGTGGRGRVIRLSADGKPFVLFDAAETEIVALARDDDATIFALAAGGPQQASATAQAAARAADAYVRVRAEPPPSSDETNDAKDKSQESEQDRPRPPQVRSSSGTGKVYRIDAAGVSTIWESTGEVPFDLLRTPQGMLFVASGDQGRIWQIAPDGKTAHVFPIASNQASALARGDDGQLWIGGTSDARVDRLETRARDRGDYVSFPIDAGTQAAWGRVVRDAVVPEGAALVVAVRSGNTTEPDETWSDWAPLSADGQIDPAAVPRARLLQVRLSLSSAGVAAPRVSALQVSYEPRNSAPLIVGLSVEAPGVVLVPVPQQPNGSLGPLIASDPVTRDAVSRATRGRGRTPTRRGYEAGVRTFSWIASDPDDDRLTYLLEVRLEDDTHWFPVATDLTDTYYSWDARAISDGRYRMRLTVSDAPDNVAGEALSHSQISEVFLVDNSRPAVSDWTFGGRGSELYVAFTAVDPGGAVAAVEVAMGDGPWQPVRPEDGIADSEVERFRLPLPGADGGTLPLSVRVRVTDDAGNLGGEMRRLDRP